MDRFEDAMQQAGFELPLKEGDAVLPSTSFGPASTFNAEGKYIKHKDQPMETAYRMVEWTWEEWRGPYETEAVSDYVEVPYQRYPRTFLPPPSIELVIHTSDQGERLVVAAMEIEFIPSNHETVINGINLFLEIFHECEIFTAEYGAIQIPALRRLNWEVLPPGRHPWDRLRQNVEEIINRSPEGNRPVIENRFETINSFGPEFHAVGRAGFRGYIVFGFPERELYILESAYYGNATYVFGVNWEELSKMTKAEILNEELQEDRIIHRKGWHQRVRRLFE